MRRTAITIRMNASTDSVTVDGRVFDRSTMTRPERNKMARLVRMAFEQETRE